MEGRRRFAAEIWALTEHRPPIFQRAGAAAPIEKPIGGMTSVSSHSCGAAASLRVKFRTARRAVPTLGERWGGSTNPRRLRAVKTSRSTPAVPPNDRSIAGIWSNSAIPGERTASATHSQTKTCDAGGTFADDRQDHLRSWTIFEKEGFGSFKDTGAHGDGPLPRGSLGDPGLFVKSVPVFCAKFFGIPLSADFHGHLA